LLLLFGDVDDDDDGDGDGDEDNDDDDDCCGVGVYTSIVENLFGCCKLLLLLLYFVKVGLFGCLFVVVRLIIVRIAWVAGC